MIHTAILALGSNMGDRLANLQNAKTELSKIGTIQKESNIYETEPVGFADQDWFLNYVIQIETDLNAQELLKETQNIEKKLGKNKLIENGPRNIDIDIIFFGDEIIDVENLKIPHPRMQDRRFVLKPLTEIAPKWIHPILQISVENLLKNIKDEHHIRLYKKSS